MNTTESNQMEVSEVCETSERLAVELVPAYDLIDGAEVEMAEELTLAVELTDAEEEIALDALVISPEGLAANERTWELRDRIFASVAPKLYAIREARAFLFRGLDDRTSLPSAIRMAGMTRD